MPATALEKSRFDHRLQERSEEAARTLIDLCAQARDLAVAEHRRVDADTPDDDGRRPYLDLDDKARAKLIPMLAQIRSQGHDLEDEKVRDAVELFVRCLQSSVFELSYTDRSKQPAYLAVRPGLLRRTWDDALRETVEILGACRRDEPLPETPRLLEIETGFNEWDAEQEENFRSWLAEEEKGRQEEREQRKREAAGPSKD